ncbi:DUF7146 domain-containing protein [Aurantimonas coralicida]|uniref:DUF7146 domain-containing protein n=1 Tax=Aurantimonas coralicida TaxID=182270 RepID=UPI001D186FCB|nr:hypothetical protein [Aurantimonas coralicida]MCC4299462.1 hypothetical protein [Aurantimonas coralicida]
MSSATDFFIEEARAVTVAEVATRLGIAGLKPAGTAESVGPCPVCGGTDRFSLNSMKNAWNCRGSAEGGGRDAISLAAHLGGHDVARRDGFLAACADVLGRPVPDGDDESDADRQARDARLAERRRMAAAERERSEKGANAWRERERAKARGKWERAGSGRVVTNYLALRLGGHPLPALPLLRAIAAEPYWHGTDDRKNPVALHEGPAMVAPFADAEGVVVGCHLTWIDLRQRKGRPVLADPEEPGETLPTKKMRGTKKGGLIPLVGFALEGERILPKAGRHRLVIGEGIENVLAVGVAEGFRADTLYAAAGDLGNLAGPADPKSAFGHPNLTRDDRNGKARPLRVQGPVPKADRAPDDAAQAPDQVTEILLVADGDSERFATGAAMLRAERRLASEGRTVATAWPPAGSDFADLLNQTRSAA